MSTGQIIGSARCEAAGRATSDSYLACFLRCTGYDLLNAQAEGLRKVFVFRDRPSRGAEVLAFYGQGAVVLAPAFSPTIKDMKALMHNA